MNKNHTITEVEITLIKPNRGLIGFGSLVLNSSLYLSSIGIYQKLSGGLRLTYPTRKVGNQNLEIFHPINHTLSQAIEEAIFARVEEIFNKNNI